MNSFIMRSQVDRVLERLGGFYVLEDIIEGIGKGDFQSFAHRDSWAVTRIAEFPRRTAIEVLFMVGTLPDLRVVEKDIIEFARKHDITIGLANGRLGFLNKAFPGWKASTATFIKDFTHG